MGFPNFTGELILVPSSSSRYYRSCLKLRMSWSEDRRMQAFIAFGSSSFFHNAPHQAKSKIFLPKTYCSMREQRRISLRTTWPSITLSLLGSGFFLGPLIDGLHSRVNLVEYQSGSIDIGPLHTDIWVNWVSEHFFQPSYFWTCLKV